MKEDVYLPDWCDDERLRYTSFVREALALHLHDPISQHLEVETYTWGVLPARYRTIRLAPAIARELEWVRQRFPA